MNRHQLTNPAAIFLFIFSGRATFTLVSGKTGTRYTYRVNRADGDNEDRPYFVNVLSGPDNTSDYRYAGFVPSDFSRIVQGRKGMNPDAPSVQAFAWTLRNALQNPDALSQIEFWHEGRCGACGRKLTDPESIERGIGPVCASI